jgi:NRPS condensation-like uncharacterized protein
MGINVLSMPGRVAKNVVDRAFSDLDSGSPRTVHAEWALADRVDLGRLTEAAEATVRQHPLLNARQGPVGDVWVVPDVVSHPSVVVTPAEDDALAGVRSELVSQGFDLAREPPVRFHLVRTPTGDRVVAVADHALVDGVGIGRVIVSLLANYERGWCGSVDERWREAHALGTGAPSPERVQATVRMLRRRAQPTAVRLAREHDEEREGYGVAYRAVSTGAVDALAQLPLGRSTVNDVFVAAFCLACMEWNRGRGAAPLPLSVGVPLNLRPARSWLEGVCNATLPWAVRIEDEDPREVLRQVTLQLGPVRTGLYSTDVRALLAYLVDQRVLPVWVRHSLATTTVVSTVPGAELVRSTGMVREPTTGLYGGAPAPATMGMTFAVIPDGGRDRLSARFLLSRHSAAGAARFLSLVDRAIVQLCELGRPVTKVGKVVAL